VATEKTLLAMPETALGLFPDVGATHFLSRLNHNLGLFLALTGYRLKGSDALHSGVATHYVNSDKLGELENALVNAVNPTNGSVNQLIKTFQPASIRNFSLEPHLHIIDKCFSANSYEEILERLKDDGSEFAQSQLKELEKMVRLYSASYAL
jgi:3-hydroxyisobutyryl-CoA hydrolase